MKVFTIKDNSQLDIKLLKMWEDSGGSLENDWPNFIKSLDSNIISVKFYHHDSPSYTAITFENEEHITWFLMRWA